jgi:hypothetical protein
LPTIGEKPGWTTLADVVQVLRRRWDSGVFLTARVTGRPWQPVSVPVRGPSAAELGENFASAQEWVRAWSGAPGSVRVESKPLGGRKVGVNLVPGRARIDTYDHLCVLLRVGTDARRFEALFDQTALAEPALLDWMACHPLKVLQFADVWTQVVGTVSWIAALPRPGVYLRQVDVPGVDTKFIEEHRSLLAELLDLRLPDARIDRTLPRSDFVARYGFRKKPSYVRVRRLGSDCLPGGYGELALPVAELASNPLSVTTVYVVENEVTYLAFPPVRDAVVVLGEGYAASRLRPLRWLEQRELVYWGDIDTHGFRILDRLRAHFPAARSLLMDRATLLAHQSQWVTEPSQVRDPLIRLTETESALYHDLVEETFGSAVRLEQERVNFGRLEAALSL